MKSFAVDFDWVMYELSYANLSLYMATLPSYDFDKKGKYHDDGRRFNADDPANDAEIRRILGFNKR